MESNVGKANAKCFGQLVLAYAEFAPSGSASQTLTNNFGIVSITRSVAGRWVATLAEKFPGFVAIVTCVENDTTNLHELQVESEDTSAGTITFRHRTAAIGSLGSLALSDTIDKVKIMVLGRPYT